MDQDHWCELEGYGGHVAQSPIQLDSTTAEEAQLNKIKFTSYNKRLEGSLKNDGHSGWMLHFNGITIRGHVITNGMRF